MLKVFGIAAALGGIALPFLATGEAVEERIKPVGELCMAGEACATAAVVGAAGAGARTGEEVYSTKCFTCHATGAAGAPKLGDAAAWQSRVDERGIDGMYESAIKGFKGMPAKGLCMDCTDEELKAAVDHILAESK